MQGATPESTGDLEGAENRLTNPRGTAWGADGAVYVALAGSNGTPVGLPELEPRLDRFPAVQT